MAVAPLYLRLGAADGAIVVEAISVWPCSRGRQLVALPGRAGEALGMADAVPEVAAATAAKDVQVLPVTCLRDALRSRAPSTSGNIIRFGPATADLPALDALLELEKVDAMVTSSGPEEDPPRSAIQHQAQYVDERGNPVRGGRSDGRRSPPAARRVVAERDQDDDKDLEEDALDAEPDDVDQRLAEQTRHLRDLFPASHGDGAATAREPVRIPAAALSRSVRPTSPPARPGAAMKDFFKLMMLTTGVNPADYPSRRKAAYGVSDVDEVRLGQDRTTRAFAKYTACTRTTRANPERVFEDCKVFAKDEPEAEPDLQHRVRGPRQMEATGGHEDGHETTPPGKGQKGDGKRRFPRGNQDGSGAVGTAAFSAAK